MFSGHLCIYKLIKYIFYNNLLKLLIYFIKYKLNKVFNINIGHYILNNCNTNNLFNYLI